MLKLKFCHTREINKDSLNVRDNDWFTLGMGLSDTAHSFFDIKLGIKTLHV